MHTFDEDNETLFVRSVGTLSKKDYDVLYDRMLEKYIDMAQPTFMKRSLTLAFLHFFRFPLAPGMI